MPQPSRTASNDLPVRLIYSSRATAPFDQRALERLLIKSRMNNQALDITGVLLYLDELFAQVLEGPAEPVLNLFELIRNDARHTAVQQLSCERIDQRLFGGWAMGFCPESRLPAEVRRGFTDYLKYPETLPQLLRDCGSAGKVLGAFREHPETQAGEGAWSAVTATV